MTASQQTRQDRQPVWAWLRLCLLLTLWQAPIPLVHAHQAPGWDASALARHVQEFHQDSADPDDCQWHWHLILPAWSHPLLPDQTDDRPADLVDFDVTVLRLDDAVGPQQAIEIVADVMDWQPPLSWQPAPQCSTARRESFLTTYLTAVPLQQLLCENRC